MTCIFKLIFSIGTQPHRSLRGLPLLHKVPLLLLLLQGEPQGVHALESKTIFLFSRRCLCTSSCSTQTQESLSSILGSLWSSSPPSSVSVASAPSPGTSSPNIWPRTAASYSSEEAAKKLGLIILRVRKWMWKQRIKKSKAVEKKAESPSNFESESV